VGKIDTIGRAPRLEPRESRVKAHGNTVKIMLSQPTRVTFLAAAALLAAPVQARLIAQSRAQADSTALVALERRWLAAEHDSATLEQILAPDFVHVVPTGDFLTKAQHIHYAVKYKPPPGRHYAFEALTVRLYGDIGIATGIVRATDANGKVDRTAFTDVFARRDAQWQAVNAQENHIEKR